MRCTASRLKNEPLLIAILHIAIGFLSVAQMSEPKRISMTTLAPAKKVSDKTQRLDSVKTQRFTLTLRDSTEESCPEFNFADLLTSVTKKKEAGGHVNGSAAPALLLDPYADDDEDELRNIAKKFEEKYGLPVEKKKKSRKYDDYIDLGAGYDENDPFIDNTDAYDEIVPAEVTTAHGGFYINSGALEFKPVEKKSDSESDSSSSSSESDSSDSESEGEAEADTSATPATKKRRVIESDDDDSKEESAGREANKSDSEATSKKKLRLEEGQNKRKKMSPVNESASKKIRPTVKELLAIKRDKEKESDAPNDKPTTGTTKTATTDSSSGSSGSSSDSSGSESSSEDEEGKDADVVENVGGEAKLPNNLSPQLLAVMEDIRKAAASSEQGKCRFFSSEINRLLLSVELQARQYSCSKRQAIYNYLAGFLPCTKHTLLKRAKNLVLESVESKLRPTIRKLQSAIEKVIPEQIERHTNQCQRLAEAK